MSREKTQERNVELVPNLRGDKLNKLNGNVGINAKAPISNSTDVFFKANVGVNNNRLNTNPNKGGEYGVKFGITKRC